MSDIKEGIERLRALRAKATAGPWRVGDGTPESNYEGWDAIVVMRIRPTTILRANIWLSDENNQFIVAAANDAIPLLEECEQRIAELERTQLEAAETALQNVDDSESVEYARAYFATKEQS